MKNLFADMAATFSVEVAQGLKGRTKKHLARQVAFFQTPELYTVFCC
jgi:hypothetical protein